MPERTHWRNRCGTRVSDVSTDLRVTTTNKSRWAENACEALPIVTRLSPGQGLAADDSRNLPNCSGNWWRGTESNCRHYDFQSYALPTELPRPRGVNPDDNGYSARSASLASTRSAIAARKSMRENPRQISDRG